MRGTDWGIEVFEPGEDGGNAEILSLTLKVHVQETDAVPALTGVYGGQPGWQYDKKAPSGTNVKPEYGDYVGGHTDGLQEGTRFSWWQSGTQESCGYLGSYPEDDENDLHWVPVVETGKWASVWESRKLFSDFSYVENEGMLDANDQRYFTLMEDCQYSTIECAIWRRLGDGLIVKQQDYQYVDEFTGVLLDGNTEREVPVPGSYETRLHEFKIVNDELILNQTAAITIMDDGLAVANKDLGKVYEHKGAGNSTDRRLYLNFFPVQNTSVKLISFDGITQTVWTEVADFYSTGLTDKHYVVDHDLGIIHLSGHKAEDLILRDAATAVATELTVWPDERINEWPASGVMLIGTEKIRYEYRSGYTFYGCVRGFLFTTAAPRTAGETVVNPQEGYAALPSEELYVGYVAVPRLEYEVTQSRERFANKATKPLDIRPLRNVETNSVLQIASTVYNLEELILTCSSGNIGSDLFGPIYFGTDSTQLTVTALDSTGNPVDDLPVTITITGVGLLNGEDTTYLGITNQLGQIHTIYTAPYSDDSVAHDVLSVTHVLTNTEMVISGLTDGISVNDITLFQVLKHDPVQGSVGRKITILAADPIAYPYGDQRLTIDAVITDDYKGGFAYIVGADNVKRWRRINGVFPGFVNVAGKDVPVTYVDYDDDITSTSLVSGDIWLFRPGSVEWDGSLQNGVRVLLYSWNALAINPVTELAGAYYPVRGTAINGNTVTFAGNLPIPAPTTDSNNLGGYVAVTKAIATAVATAVDPVSGRLIQSNTLRLLIDLPRYLKGADEALTIPYGFRLRDEEHNHSAGLGGSTFLTVNPAAEGLNQFSIYVEV